MINKTLLILSSLPLLVMYTEGVLIPSLPMMQKEYGVSESMISWILSLYLAFGTISTALFGKLGDVYGKKRMMMLAMSIYIIGVIITGFAPNFTILLISRAIQGAGMSMMPLALSLVREQFPTNMIPQVQGIISAMYGIGILISLPTGSFISQYYGWQATYHTIIPFIILVYILIAFLINESKYKNRQKIDWVGATLLSLSLMSGIIGISEGPIFGWTSIQFIILSTISIVTLIIFAIYERKIDSPIIPLNIISSRNVAIANFGISIVGFAFQLIAQTIIFILEIPRPYGYGLPILYAGLWMVPNALTQLILAPIIGRKISRLGVKIFSIIGAIVTCIGFIAISQLAFVDLPYIVLSMIIIASGSTLLNVSLINLLIFSTNKANLGVTTGLNTTFRFVGSAWGPAIAGTIMTQFKDRILLSSKMELINIPSHLAYQLIFYIAASMFAILAILLLKSSEVIKGGKIANVVE